METIQYSSKREVVYDILKGLPKIGAHVVLGLLPEQEKLEEKISWYDANSGVELSAAAEVIAGMLWPYIKNDAAQSAAIGGSLEAVLFRYGSIRIGEKDERVNVFGTTERLGSIYLEIPYRLVKKSIKKLKERKVPKTLINN